MIGIEKQCRAQVKNEPPREHTPFSLFRYFSMPINCSWSATRYSCCRKRPKVNALTTNDLIVCVMIFCSHGRTHAGLFSMALHCVEPSKNPLIIWKKDAEPCLNSFKGRKGPLELTYELMAVQNESMSVNVFLESVSASVGMLSFLWAHVTSVSALDVRTERHFKRTSHVTDTTKMNMIQVLDADT